MYRKPDVSISICLLLLFDFICSALNILLWSIRSDDANLRILFLIDRIAILLLLSVQVVMILLWFRTNSMRKDIARSVAHNIKTPIEVIGASNEYLAGCAGVRNDKDACKYLTISNNRLKSLEHMADMALCCLQVRASGMRRIASVDVRELCKNLASDLDLLYYAVHITIDIQPGLYVKADPDDLHFILTNLAENAVKYSGGIPSIRFYSYMTGSGVNLAVEDHGSGIPRRERRKVFRKYYRGGNNSMTSVSSFGLGLYFVRRECRHYHWHISVRDTPGGGSTFVLRIKTNGR